MSEFLYQLAIRAAASALDIAAHFNPKIKLGTEGRKNVFADLENALKKRVKTGPVVWFHAASLGEFEQGRPVIEALRELYPGHFIVLTFISPSGYEVRKNYTGADHICYLPLDTPTNAHRFVQMLNPQVAFFIKYEFWHNYVAALHANQSRILSFSAKFRPDQIFFKSYGGFFRNILRRFDQIFVQNEESVKLLQGAGIMHCRVAGDTRFDRVQMIARKAPVLTEMQYFPIRKPCLVAGSVWDADMQVVAPTLNYFQGVMQAIIAPHEIHAEEIAGWRKLLKGKSVLYSELKAATGPIEADYLIVDNIGLLSALYRYGNMAYIGGGFGSGLHNILEAATFGLPIVFGNKKYGKFQEAIDLIQQGGAKAVGETRDCVEVLERWVENPASATDAGQTNRHYVASGTGSTDLIMHFIKDMLR